METPVFEEFEPRTGCACAGCVHGRRAVSVSSRSRRTGCLTVRKAVALAAVAGATLAAGQAMPVAAAAQVPLRPGVPTGDQPPDTPQGRTAPLHGSGGVSAPALAPAATRAQIINRAKVWVAAKVPYSMDDYWSDGYRQDCSGFVSMAWNLGSNEWTGSLDKFGVRISKEEMQPGDILLFHNAANPERGSHVVIFGGWTDYTHKKYTAYEETPPRARKLATPYAYWTNSSRYVPYRYKNLTESKAAEGTDEQPPASAGVPGVPPGYSGGAVAGSGAVALPGPSAWSLGQQEGAVASAAGASAVAAGSRSVSPGGVPDYPGPGMFRPGADNPYITRLGRRLIEKGFGKHYTEGPGPRWGELDRRSVEAFQRAQGWRGGAADGFPGPETWRRLFS
ncbi:peptidoglycan-binding protein [Streptomyces chiangmaiensis]|uniref:Peptidoglycan-binding protein n=1 Tax=Streptomyces chiangmaiensis TaxID=766497 RepID=A0ABU7FW83_9ACTN|nr:peptidoglycan-binding protein [Streptomyces chiangmaiensis]MED7828342.1 peptidoglycan-binding protein [Streptomyces chiangmaiensis]